MGNTAKKDARAAAIAERQRKALELRKGGATYEQIAKSLGLADKSNARQDVQAAILAIIEEPAKEVLRLELDRCDAMLLGLWQKAKSGDGAAVDRVLRIMDRRACYLGLDAPKKQEHSGSIETKGSHDALLYRIAHLAQSAAAGAGDPRSDD